MKNKFIWLYIIIGFIFSYGLGLLVCDKFLLGSTTLFLIIVQAYFTINGKWQGEIFGVFCIIISTLVFAFTSMYASAIFTITVYIPLSLFKVINWRKHENNKVVILNNMSFKKTILTILIILSSTLLVSFIISLIPTQKLAVLDSAINILDIAGVILIALRYKEGFIAWILCNLTEISTWIIILINNYSQNAILMIVTSLVCIALNIWGLISFTKIHKTQEQSNINNVTQIKKI